VLSDPRPGRLAAVLSCFRDDTERVDASQVMAASAALHAPRQRTVGIFLPEGRAAARRGSGALAGIVLKRFHAARGTEAGERSIRARRTSNAGTRLVQQATEDRAAAEEDTGRNRSRVEAFRFGD